MTNDKSVFYDSEDLSKLFDCSKSYAYKIIAQMNHELKEQGYFTIPGKVPRAYCATKVYGYNAQF